MNRRNLLLSFGRLLRPRHPSLVHRRLLIVPPGVGEPTCTNEDVIRTLSEAVIGGPQTYDPEGYRLQREKLSESELPRSQDEMVPRRMSDSFDHSLIPLAEDLKLRDRYLTHLGGVRMGRLLEDMDVFGAHLAFKHVLLPARCGGAQSPFSIVTALLDRIAVEQRIVPDEDMKLSGHVTWVGRSSAEATLNLHQKRKGDGGGWAKIIEANFVYVARDSLNMKAAVINPLLAETAEEKRLFELGERHYLERRRAAGYSLLRQPPSEEENRIIHEIFVETVDPGARTYRARVKPEGSVWMEDAKLKTVVVCQPEHRNRFNKIFGGFIMRQAFELAWACAYVFAGNRRPFVRFMDDILFERPVEIGSLLYFNSIVAYTQGKHVQVRVAAEALDPNTKAVDVTNTFHYTFALEDGDAPRVLPKTYHEAMMYLNARRHFLASTRGGAGCSQN